MALRISVTSLFAALLISGSSSPLYAESGLYQVRVESAGAGARVSVSPSSGVHVNPEAPLWLRGPSPDALKGQAAGGAVSWTLPSTLQAGTDVQLEFSLCDDANTWCKPHKVHFAYAPGQAEQAAEPLKGPSAPSHTAGHAAAIPGALQDDLEQALSLAQEKGQLVLMDFHGIWCPPCQMMVAEGFADARVKQAAAELVIVQLDADKPSSWEAKSRYAVRGYPTLILARADGTEISRVEGYGGADALASWLTTNMKTGKPLKELIAARNQGDRTPEVLLPLARSLTFMGLNEEAARLYAEMLPSLTGEDLVEARVAVLKDATRRGDKKQAKAQLSALGKVNPAPEGLAMAVFDAARGASGDASALVPEIQRQAVEITERQLEDPSFQGARLANLHEERAFLFDALDQPERSRAASSQAADAWLALERALPGTGPERYASFRGQARNLTGDLLDAGRLEEAEAIHLKLIQAFPDEFTYYYDYAAMLLAANRPADARPIAEKAVQHAYGDNRLRSVARLADVMVAQGDTQAAISLLESTIAAEQLPSDPNVRTHRYVDSLRKQLERLKAPAQPS